MTSTRVRRKAHDPDIIPDEEPPTQFGQHVSTDTFMVAKSSSDERKLAGGGEYCFQTNRDTYSGLFLPYPLTKHSTPFVKETLPDFNP